MTLREAHLINRTQAAIQTVLHPGLLKPEYRAINANNPMYGHCYAAAESFYYMCAGELGFAPMRAKDDAGVVHWWLESRMFPGRRLDPTSAQYASVGKQPPYERGKFGGFLTSKPSKRAQEIIRLAQKKLAETR